MIRLDMEGCQAIRYFSSSAFKRNEDFATIKIHLNFMAHEFVRAKKYAEALKLCRYVTTVILSELSKFFPVEDVERKLAESVPLKAPDFAVYVNGRVYPRSLVGRRIPLLEGTKYGPVTGEIVVTPRSAADFKDLGIEVKVKGATVKKGLFGKRRNAVILFRRNVGTPTEIFWSLVSVPGIILTDA